MTAQWIDVAAASAIPEGEVIGVVAAGRYIALYNAGDTCYATDGVCSHGHANLCEGFLEGHEIECPLHQGKFDIRNGQPTCDPVTEPIRSYPLRIEGGRILVELGLA